MPAFKVVSSAPRRRLTTLSVLFTALWIAWIAWPASTAAAQPALSLDEALAIAVRDSPLLAAQRSVMVSAEQSAYTARELPDPQLKIGVDNLPLEGGDKWSFTRDFMTMRRIGVAQAFIRSEKREIKGRRAEHQLAREQATLGDARAGLRRDLATAWIACYYAEQLAQVVDVQYAETRLQRDALQAGVATGRTTLSEQIALDTSLQLLLNRKLDFDRQAASARAQLTRWLGEAAKRPLAPLPDAAPSGALALRTPHHPHLQALERQIDVAQSEADLAKSATRPDWGLELSYTQRGAAYSNMLGLQISIDLPLFAERRQNREAVARTAQVTQAHALREEALRQHIAEATVAKVEWDAAHARVQRFDDALLPLARNNVAIALAAYRGGLSPLAPVLEARRAELDLRLQKLQLQAELGRARAQLVYFLPEEAAK